MTQAHKAHKSAPRRHHKTITHKPQFSRTIMKQSRGPQRGGTVEGFIASVERDIEEQRELQEFE